MADMNALCVCGHGPHSTRVCDECNLLITPELKKKGAEPCRLFVRTDVYIARQMLHLNEILSQLTQVSMLMLRTLRGEDGIAQTTPDGQDRVDYTAPELVPNDTPDDAPTEDELAEVHRIFGDDGLPTGEVTDGN